MLDSLFHGAALPPLVPSPPGWNAYVDLLEQFLDFLARTLHSGGLAVIAFTIIVKTILLPLTIRATRSSRAMQDLQPKIKELQKKYGKDRQKLSQETMKLYQQYQVNPMAGCLPMLIQMPIFFGVYRAISHLSTHAATEGASQYWDDPFLWLPNLAHPDPYHILPIMAGVFQFMQTKMMKPAGQGKSTDPQQAMMNQVMMFMPVTVVIFGWNFASGPVLYWVTQSIYSVVQQWLITGWGSMLDWFPFLPDLPEHRRLGYRPPRNLDDIVVVTGEDGTVHQPGIMGWFNKKMQEAQAIQAEKQAESGKSSSAAAEPKTKQPRPVKKEQAAAAKKKQEPAEPAAESSEPEIAGEALEADLSAEANGAAKPVPRKSSKSSKKASG